MTQTDPRKRPPQNGGQPAPGTASIPGAVIRMKQPTPQNLPQQKPIDDEEIPQELPTPWWKKALKRILLILLVVVALVFAYLFLLMGEPEEDLETTSPVQAVQPITIPMNALEAPGDAYLPSLAETFGQPVLGIRSPDVTLQRARVYDTAFGGEYARRVTLNYLLSDGGEMVVESIRPISDVDALGKSTPAPAEQKLWVKIPCRDEKLMRRLGLILNMFPGEQQMIIYCQAENKRIGARCLIHDALVAELSELLGSENVIVK